VSALVLHGQRSQLVPVTDEHVAELRRIRAAPEVGGTGGTWTPPLAAARRAVGREVRCPRRCEVRGLAQYTEEDDENYRHASIDIFLDPLMQGQGLGRDSVATLARYLVDHRGHHRLVIDPAADNTAAIRCYASVGFRPVGVMRRYERDAHGEGWHDGLLMDLLAKELQRGSTDGPRPGSAALAQPISTDLTGAPSTQNSDTR